MIVGMDIAAVIYVYTGDYEYKDYQLQHSINLFITTILLAFDGAIGLIQLICMMYLLCALCHRVHVCFKKTTCCLEKCCPCCMIPFFYAIFGYRIIKDQNVWSMPESHDVEERNYGIQQTGRDQQKQNRVVTNQRIMWTMLCMLAAPLFSIGSHSAYILISWLIQPSHTTSTVLVAIAILLYVFLLSRQCYMAHDRYKLRKSSKYWSFFILLFPIWQCVRHCINIVEAFAYYIEQACPCCKPCCDRAQACCKPCCKQTDDSETGNAVSTEKNPLLPKSTKASRSDKQFNLQAFFIMFGWGILTVGSIAFTVVAFYEAPFKTLDLVTYLLNVFQIFIVLIALLITYKIFSLGESDFLRFFKHMRETYQNSKNPEENKERVSADTVDDIEASGIMTGSLFKVVIHEEGVRKRGSGSRAHQ